MNLANLNPGTGVTVYAYEKGQMTMPSKTAVYGSYVKVLLTSMNPFETYEYKYRIIQDELLALDQPAQRCHDNSRDMPSVSQCIAEYFEAKHNCSLYMIESLRQREDCNEDIASSEKNENTELIEDWEMKTEPEIYKMTGCMPSCKKQQISLETEEEITRYESYKEDAKIQLMFHFRDGMYNLNEEYLVYDYNNFIADIGGYLGLLLGHSILSIYSMSADWITKPIRTIKKWLSPGSKKK